MGRRLMFLRRSREGGRRDTHQEECKPGVAVLRQMRTVPPVVPATVQLPRLFTGRVPPGVQELPHVHYQRQRPRTACLPVRGLPLQLLRAPLHA